MAFTLTIIGITVAFGLLAAWSFVGMVQQAIRHRRAGADIHARLRPNSAFSPFKEPLLPMSAEAARLPETADMMGSYWKGMLYGLVFLSSGAVFAFLALIVLGMWMTA